MKMKSGSKPPRSSATENELDGRLQNLMNLDYRNAVLDALLTGSFVESERKVGRNPVSVPHTRYACANHYHLNRAKLHDRRMRMLP